MSSKIFMAINSYKIIENINPGIIEYLERVLSNKTKHRIEKGSVHLHILAVIFKQAVNQKKEDVEVDRLVNKMLDDTNFIIRLGRELDDVNM